MENFILPRMAVFDLPYDHNPESIVNDEEFDGRLEDMDLRG